MDKNHAAQPNDAAIDALRVEAADPATSPHRLHELSTSHPSVLPALASNPSLYPELRQWLASLGNPAIDEGLALGAARAAAGDHPWTDAPNTSNAKQPSAPDTPLPGAPVRTPFMQRAAAIHAHSITNHPAPSEQTRTISTTDPSLDLPPVYIPVGRAGDDASAPSALSATPAAAHGRPATSPQVPAANASPAASPQTQTTSLHVPPTTSAPPAAMPERIPPSRVDGAYRVDGSYRANGAYRPEAETKPGLSPVFILILVLAILATAVVGYLLGTRAGAKDNAAATGAASQIIAAPATPAPTSANATADAPG